MSPFDPFREGGRQKGTMSSFFTVFLSGERPLTLFYKACFYFVLLKVKYLLESPEEYNKYHAWRSHFAGLLYVGIQGGDKY